MTKTKEYSERFSGATCAITPLGPDYLDYACSLSGEVAAQWRYHGIPVPVERVAADLLGSANATMVVLSTSGSRPVGLAIIDGWNHQDQVANLAIAVEDSVRRTRIALEATLLTLRFAFETLPLRRVLMQSPAFAYKQFASAVRRGHFQELGRLPHHYYSGGKWHDLVLLAVDRDDWLRLEQIGSRLFRPPARPIGTSDRPDPERTVEILPLQRDAFDPLELHRRLVMGARSRRWALAGPWPSFQAAMDQLDASVLPFQWLAVDGKDPLALCSVGELDPTRCYAPLNLDILSPAAEHPKVLVPLVTEVVAAAVAALPLRTMELRIPSCFEGAIASLEPVGFVKVGSVPQTAFWRGAWHDEAVLACLAAAIDS